MRVYVFLRMRGMELPEIVPFVLITYKQNSLRSVPGSCLS
jgi:hypothetical protein